MSKIIGIDLGTTNSCVSVMEGKEAKVITKLNKTLNIIIKIYFENTLYKN